MEAISQLTHALTGKDNLQDCSESELRNMVRLYPFFAPAQLLLARKTKAEKENDAADVIANAALFIPNALWFGQLMEDSAETLPHADTSTTHHTVLESAATVEDVIAQSSSADEDPVETVMPERTIVETPATTEEVIEQPAAVTDERSELIEPAETESSSDTDDQTTSDTYPDEKIQETPATMEEVIEQVMTSQSHDDVSVHDDETFTSDAVDSPESASGISAEDNEPELRPIPTFKIEPLEPGKMELSFEPYHTVDYFASQGIRFKDDDKPKDRLSLQLKSFTEWLKTLKKSPSADAPTAGDRQEEKKVEQMARVSVNDPHVVTEAMAEVWEIQGNTVKAIELYQKLSLLDPDKSAYFAAKIELLKQL